MNEQEITSLPYDTQAGGWDAEEYYLYDDMEVA